MFINFFRTASVTLFFASVFFLMSSAVLTIKMIICLMKQEEEYDRYVVELVLTVFIGLVLLGVSALAFIASRHF